MILQLLEIISRYSDLHRQGYYEVILTIVKSHKDTFSIPTIVSEIARLNKIETSSEALISLFFYVFLIEFVSGQQIQFIFHSFDLMTFVINILKYINVFKYINYESQRINFFIY